MKKLYNPNKSILHRTMAINYQNLHMAKKIPKISGYFICDENEDIIEQSINFKFLYTLGSSINIKLENLFELYLLSDGSPLVSSSEPNGEFKINHKLKDKMFHINYWTMPNGNRYFFYEEINNKNELPETVRRHFNYLFDLMPMGLLVWDNKREITYINSFGEDYFKMNKRELIGKSVEQFLISIDIPLNEIHNRLKELRRIKYYVSKCYLKRQDREELYFEYFIIKELYENINLLVFIDETEQVKTFDVLHRSDTLNVVGQLAAGIAHEIRNPMTSIRGFVDLIKPELDSRKELFYEVIQSELERIDLIINEFLYLSKPKSYVFANCDLVQIVKSSVELMQGQFSLHSITLITNYSSSTAMIYASANELKKVFINLLKNAQEVVDSKGIITVSFTEESERYCVSITDNGCGMTEEQLEQVGKAFFTTKEKGVGLGLYVTNKIIDEHKGYIKINSILGEGTTFTVNLPKIKDNTKFSK